MIGADVVPVPLQRTPPREAREGYCRYLLTRAGYDEAESTDFLNSKQSVLFNCSPMELLYTGRADMAISATEILVESLPLEEE